MEEKQVDTDFLIITFLTSLLAFSLMLIAEAIGSDVLFKYGSIYAWLGLATIGGTILLATLGYEWEWKEFTDTIYGVGVGLIGLFILAGIIAIYARTMAVWGIPILAEAEIPKVEFSFQLAGGEFLVFVFERIASILGITTLSLINAVSVLVSGFNESIFQIGLYPLFRTFLEELELPEFWAWSGAIAGSQALFGIMHSFLFGLQYAISAGILGIALCIALDISGSQSAVGWSHAIYNLIVLATLGG